MSLPALGFLGAGNMAEALLRGLLETRTCLPSQLYLSDPNGERTAFLSEALGVHTVPDNPALAAKCPVLVLAVKPQQVPLVLSQVRDALDPTRHVLVSVAAGVPTPYLEKVLGKPLRLVRAMPNTPAKVRAGTTAYCLGRHAGPSEDRLAQTLFSAVGLAVKLDEGLLDAVTALSGSGPAYVFRLCEVLTSAGTALGLPADEADRLARQTLYGAALMLKESGESAETLRRAVTSPGGTTEAALKRLEAGGLSELFQDALRAARDRARELAPRPPDMRS
jgi:pyrroline-5-carboxylate reductase